MAELTGRMVLFGGGRSASRVVELFTWEECQDDLPDVSTCVLRALRHSDGIWQVAGDEKKPPFRWPAYAKVTSL
jgi:hypothetical protein